MHIKLENHHPAVLGTESLERGRHLLQPAARPSSSRPLQTPAEPTPRALLASQELHQHALWHPCRAVLRNTLGGLGFELKCSKNASF